MLVVSFCWNNKCEKQPKLLVVVVCVPWLSSEAALLLEIEIELELIHLPLLVDKYCAKTFAQNTESWPLSGIDVHR